MGREGHKRKLIGTTTRARPQISTCEDLYRNPTDQHHSIVDFMAKQILPTVSVLESKQAHDNFLFQERGEVVIVGYIDSSDTASNATLFAAAEKLHEDFPIGVTSDLAAAQSAGVTFPSIVLYRPDNDGKEVFEKKWDVDAIKTFAKEGYKPLIGEVGADTWRQYVEGSNGPTGFIFAKAEADRKRLAAELRQVAKKHVGAVQFATAEIPDFAGFAGYLHLPIDTDADFPSFGIYDGASKKKYPFSGRGAGLDGRSVGSFVEDFLAGRVQPSVKSEPVPSSQDSPVTAVVANNYNDLVMDSGKDVLLYYFREDCPYCRALAPVYETLASMYSASDRAEKIVIAKMDVIKNDIPENIPYVPYIKLYKAGDKANAPVYNGDRSVKDLVSFVKEHGTHHVEGIHEHEIAQDTVHSGGSGDAQKPFALHEPPLQGSTPMRHIHDEL